MRNIETKKYLRLTGVLLILILGAAAVYVSSNFGFSKPCAVPIRYSLNSFDNRFNISQDEFLAALDQAASVWELPIGRNLFEYNAKGVLKINLVYDYRQEATDKLKSLGFRIDDTQSSYDALRSRYLSISADYEIMKKNLDAEYAAYNEQRQAYEEQVNYWNSRGGAPKNIVNQLNAEAARLKIQAEKIKSDQDQVNQLAQSANAMVDVLNRMAKNLNLTVDYYNSVDQSRGEEFEEGAYIEKAGSKQIDIYEFDSQEKLVRVLAHEMGHALGLDHINSNPEAIMYYLNQGSSEKTSPEDVAALKQLCGLNSK